MSTTDQKITAQQLRERIIELLTEHPEGMRTGELQKAILGEATNEDDHRRDQIRTSSNLKALLNAKVIRKFGGIQSGVWRLLKNQPEIEGLPVRRGPRGSYKKRAGVNENGNGNGGQAAPGLASYLLRSIKQQLAELEALLVE